VQGSEVEGREEKAERPQDTSWRTWLKADFLRYWYMVGCLFLDSVVFLEVYLQPDRPLSLAAFVLVALVGLEILLYLRIWRRQKIEDL